MTSTPSTSTRPARSQSACSIGSRAKASAALEMSVPYSRAIHSSGHKRSAGSSRSSALARVVFPEQGSPQIRCSVAVMFPPKVSCRAMKPPNGGVDAAARIKASSAAPSKLREALPPLASNELLGSVLIRMTLAVIWNSSFSQTLEQLLIVGVTFQDVRCASLSQPESTVSLPHAYE